MAHSMDAIFRPSLSELRQQWQAILDRSVVPPGKRQVAFTPVEILLCMYASRVVNHRRYGGSTAHLAEEPVQLLARLFKRPPSSILAKMANLDGSRTHGGRGEVEAAEKFAGSPDDYKDVYRRVMRTARSAGIASEVLPDFLGLK
ncbi:putative restriction endonuclease [Pedococcus cremeus]|uniref:Putative restriction endonuclease n=1 Tax=Pedococcus cremeus TaxID=587636 RepID=A0A1H9QKN9_9MICO|nr:hypothetical protein [Pedococcus cremeus]SER60998.1 putative restriction endonuclease [Pedococcus cremeus]